MIVITCKYIYMRIYMCKQIYTHLIYIHIHNYINTHMSHFSMHPSCLNKIKKGMETTVSLVGVWNKGSKQSIFYKAVELKVCSHLSWLFSLLKINSRFFRNLFGNTIYLFNSLKCKRHHNCSNLSLLHLAFKIFSCLWTHLALEHLYSILE